MRDTSSRGTLLRRGDKQRDVPRSLPPALSLCDGDTLVLGANAGDQDYTFFTLRVTDTGSAQDDGGAALGLGGWCYTATGLPVPVVAAPGALPQAPPRRPPEEEYRARVIEELQIALGAVQGNGDYNSVWRHVGRCLGGLRHAGRDFTEAMDAAGRQIEARFRQHQQKDRRVERQHRKHQHNDRAKKRKQR